MIIALCKESMCLGGFIKMDKKGVQARSKLVEYKGLAVGDMVLIHGHLNVFGKHYYYPACVFKKDFEIMGVL